MAKKMRRIKITEEGELLLKSNPMFWIKRRLFKEVCITQKQWDNMTTEEKNKLLEETREKSE